MAEAKKHSSALSCEELAGILNTSPDGVCAAFSHCRSEDVVCYPGGEQSYLIDRAESERLRRRALGVIADFHQKNPLTEKGRTAEELVGLLGLRGPSAAVTVRLLLAGLEAEGSIKKAGHTWALADHAVRPDPRLQEQIDCVVRHIQQCGMNAPRTSDLLGEAARQGIDEATLDQILRHLIDKKEICYADGIYVDASLAGSCREKLLRALAQRDEGMTVAEFRDLVAGNRKVCLVLFSLYDAEGVTRRAGDVRVLTSTGREIAQTQGRPRIG